MTNRYVAGNIGGGAFGARASLAGYDPLTEPLGSAGISFDTRLSDIGTVVAAGLIQCDGAAVSFPTMPYVPIAHIARWDGSNLFDNDIVYNTVSGAGNNHSWIPGVALVTTNTLQVASFTTPWYSTSTMYNPSGAWYLYYVFAAG